MLFNEKLELVGREQKEAALLLQPFENCSVELFVPAPW